MGKTDRIITGIGNSKKTDSYLAAKEAAQQAIQGFTVAPDFTIVYTDSSCDPEGVLKGINEIIGTNWIGVSTDKQFSNKSEYDPSTKISVLTLSSKYMYFGISVADDYRKDPTKKAKEAISQSMAKVKVDRYVEAYVHFSRMKKKEFNEIVKNPPYFVLTFLSGVKVINGKTIVGEESEFIHGILEYTGPNIPMFGGSASSDLDEYINGKADNFQFANGKLYRNAAIVVFVVSNLAFTTTVEHGYDTTNDFAAVTKLSNDGFEILELNGKEPITEYCRLLKISKEKYFKDPSTFIFSRPFGLVQIDGTAYVKEALPTKNKKTLQCNFQLHKNSVLNVLEFDKSKTLNTLSDIIGKAKTERPKAGIALALFCVCSGRRPLIKGIEQKEVSAAIKSQIPFFGFYSFSEVGSTIITSPQSHSQTITSLIIYDQLISE